MGWLHALNFFDFKPSFLREYSSNQDVADSDTFMIVAGPCGSGKSTLLQAAYREKLPLFGSEFAECFRKSCRDRSYQEYDDYKIAWRKRSFFQASHVKLLAREPSLPQFVLLHVDLYQVLRGIDFSYWPRSLRKRELLKESRGEKGNGEHRLKAKLAKRSMDRLRLSSENDQMMRAYLQHSFFKRFRRIVVNTVRCGYSENAQQLSARKTKMRANGQASRVQPRYKYFQASDAMAQAIHHELYASWDRNLSLLDPAAIFTTQVSESGDLLLNGSLLVAEWSKRFQRISY